jgi:hypothetical protein
MGIFRKQCYILTGARKIRYKIQHTYTPFTIPNIAQMYKEIMKQLASKEMSAGAAINPTTVHAH